MNSRLGDSIKRATRSVRAWSFQDQVPSSRFTAEEMRQSGEDIQRRAGQRFRLADMMERRGVKSMSVREAIEWTRLVRDE